MYKQRQINNTFDCFRFAVGSTVELALKIARGEVKNGFAVVRPPGRYQV